MKEKEILEKALLQAKELIEAKKTSQFPDIISMNIDALVKKIDSNKSLLSVMVTSLAKKITTPKQDIRLHRTDFRGGYSARSLDTGVTVPFFKIHFPHLQREKKSNGL
jgi:DNA (cytosine-5)-methyltransferase 1